ncbi:hypothetical protein [Pseudobutyrivibrio xylanivorans]|uniref:ATP-binding protein n=1 Tax=Pseudobutyrivibrio xylanivorans TaxID=185007 RepID=A0A5P6VWA0_PSEXY|nr:hypothetical protein [Pseudobutyrivibrio xylanivorans]QFJ56341.1 hypothetical protein FXF36_15615 [Pseudobutyrivibrio xylanivorans]
MQNPFTHAFGAKPIKYISPILTEEILENFTYPQPSERAYILTGVRGSGKTVMLSTIARELSERKDWIVYNLNATVDMVGQLAAKLSEHPMCAKHFVKPKGVSLSVASISVGFEYNKEKVFDIYTMISNMIETLAAKGIKVLITIDDVMANEEMKIFAHTFQQLLTDSRDLPVYLIMTGLYTNYKDIQNKEDFKGSTFLTRLLEKEVEPLDESQMAVSYCNTFNIDEPEGIRLAKMTKGYAFAYQLLGYWYFEKYINEKDSVRDVEMEYRSELIKYCYSKLWTELSEKDKIIVKAMTVLNADAKKIKREDILKYLESINEGMKSTTFGTYRERLVGKGIVATSDNREGLYWLTLPEFGNYVRLYHID